MVNEDSDGDGVCDSDEVFGCTNPLYEEYSADATEDDGSCLTLSLDGCTDSAACNYNVSATDNDGYILDLNWLVSPGDSYILTTNSLTNNANFGDNNPMLKRTTGGLPNFPFFINNILEIVIDRSVKRKTK